MRRLVVCHAGLPTPATALHPPSPLPSCPPSAAPLLRRKSGHGNYPYGPQDWAVGARVVQLRQGRSAADAETWIRTQDGQREDEEPTSEDAIAEEAQGACSPPTNVLSMLE